jgi:hypothetical protein
MPTLASNQILFFLSGGPTNPKPEKSLGGMVSSYPARRGINGLFTDTTQTTAALGRTDYRCFYVFNSSTTGTLYGASIHLESVDIGNVELALGVSKRTESQILSVTGPVFFGLVRFSFGDARFSASWNGSPDAFMANMLLAMRSIGLLGVEITYSLSGNEYKFVIVFSGVNGNKAQPLLNVSENFLAGIETPEVSISRQTIGSPINVVATETASPETIPHDVVFVETSPLSKILVGTLGPKDYMAVWVRRTTPPQATAKQDASVVIRVSGSDTPI